MTLKRYKLTCSNPECPALAMGEYGTHDKLDDWLDMHGRTLFWIDTPADTYSKVYDVYHTIYHDTYEFHNKEQICCSLCNSGAIVTPYVDEPDDTVRSEYEPGWMTRELLESDETLKALRGQLSGMKMISQQGPIVHAYQNGKYIGVLPRPADAHKPAVARVKKLEDWIERRTYCLTNHLPNTCDCIQKRVYEIIDTGRADHLFRVVEESEGPLTCRYAPDEGMEEWAAKECTPSIPVGAKVPVGTSPGGDEFTYCEACYREYLSEGPYEFEDVFKKDGVIQVIEGIPMGGK
tara:strand:+ start:2342 stop:3217 length:876 start_codon:yes stop_codon:yes gene_type:complete